MIKLFGMMELFRLSLAKLFDMIKLFGMIWIFGLIKLTLVSYNDSEHKFTNQTLAWTVLPYIETFSRELTFATLCSEF